MKDATLKLKNHIQNVEILNNNIEVRRVILNSMVAVFGGLALMYVLVLGSMVLNIVERKSLEKEALTLSNDVSELELSYLDISNSIDLKLSSTMGFVEIKPTFATRKAVGSIKLANNEI